MRKGSRDISEVAHRCIGAFVQNRLSPVSRSAAFLTIGLAIAGPVISIGTNFSFTTLPNIVHLIAAVLVIDVLSRFAPQTRTVVTVQTLLFGILYLAITCVCAVVAAYASQRFGLPLRDQFFADIDSALGLNWLEFVRWVDKHPVIHQIFHWAYSSLSFQVALPVVVLAFLNRLNEVRVYVLAFALALTLTITISALLPAAGPIAAVDPMTFDIMRFTGATPVEHLMRLREPGQLILTDAPGGIATFPSFHATVAVLVPLTLRRYRGLLVILLMLDAAMLAGTITEGAHYFCDTIAGIAMAFFSLAVAKRLIAVEDRISAFALLRGTDSPLRPITSQNSSEQPEML